MTKVASFRIGRASLDVTLSGCVTCNTIASSGWVVERTVEVTVGHRVEQANVWQCVGCTAKAVRPQSAQLAMPLTEATP